MRSVHLIKSSRTIRSVEKAASCSCCDGNEPAHGKVVFIEGYLVDGSSGRHRFIEYPDCFSDVAHDVDEIDQGNDCFSDGSATEAIDMDRAH